MNLQMSVVNNVADRLFERMLLSRFPEHRKLVKTLGWISSHDASQIAAKMPADYAGGDPALYAEAIKDSSPMFTEDGVMPDGGPDTVLDVLGTFSDDVKSKKDSIDLTKTYTTQFSEKANKG